MLYRQLTPTQREKVERLIARGKQSFVWRRGVLGWGLPVFVTTTAWRYIDTLHRHASREIVFYATVIMLPIWLVGGYVVGVSMWQYYVGLLHSQKN
jgi:hypothetical protein